MEPHARERGVVLNADGARLPAALVVPNVVRGAILIAHLADSRQTPWNRYVASALQQAGFATLHLDLLMPDEDLPGMECLVTRLVYASEWLSAEPATCGLPVACFATGAAAAAALIAAPRLPGTVHAVVSCGGRPDLAGDRIRAVTCPTLLIVGGSDASAVSINWRAFEQLADVDKRLYTVLGTGNRFDEPGALEQVTEATREWFVQHLTDTAARRAENRLEALVSAET